MNRHRDGEMIDLEASELSAGTIESIRKLPTAGSDGEIGANATMQTRRRGFTHGDGRSL